MTASQRIVCSVKMDTSGSTENPRIMLHMKKELRTLAWMDPTLNTRQQGSRLCGRVTGSLVMNVALPRFSTPTA